MFPADYFCLSDSAGGPGKLREHFELRYLFVGGEPRQLEETWDFYMSGIYGVCLRHVSPETIVRKGRLVATLTALLADPMSQDEDWKARTRRSVAELDALERDFSPDYDRNSRFDYPPTRDRLIAYPRSAYGI